MVFLYQSGKEVGAFVGIFTAIITVLIYAVPQKRNRRRHPKAIPPGNSGESKQPSRVVIIISVLLIAFAILILFSKQIFDLRGMEPVEVPFVEGKTYVEAILDLQSADLREKVICEDDSEDWSNYIVTEQRPAAGEMALTKTEVKLFLTSSEARPEGANTQSENPKDTPSGSFNILLAAAPEFGDVSISPRSALSGSKVEVNIMVNDWDFTITLADNDGNELEYERTDAGFFEFIMPNSDVTVYLASASTIPDEPAVPGVCRYGLFNCPTRSFSDLDPDAWYHEAVDFVISNDLMGGYSDTFLPEGTVTRAGVANILCKMTGWPDAITFNDSFTDVLGDEWYAPAVSWAANNGIMGGYSDGTFRPDAPVTVEEFILILWRFAGSPTDRFPYAVFTDQSKISQYAIDAVGWAAGQGFLLFADGTLNPQQNITRIEVAEILKNFMEAQ